LPAFFTRLLAFLKRALVFGAMHPPPHMKEPVSGCKLRAPRYAAATRPPVPPPCRRLADIRRRSRSETRNLARREPRPILRKPPHEYAMSVHS
jgi:hypothetical protein